jgi:hypothetical protein
MRPTRIDYLLIGKEILASMNGEMYKTILKKQKVIKLIGDLYEKKFEIKKRTTT